MYFDRCNYICFDLIHHISFRHYLYFLDIVLFFLSTPVLTFSIDIVFILSIDINNLTMDYCWICDCKMLQHVHNITCSVCFKSYHLKCIYRSCRHRIYWTKSKYLSLYPLFNKYISIQQPGKWYWLYVNHEWISFKWFSDRSVWHFLPFELNDSVRQYRK